MVFLVNLLKPLYSRGAIAEVVILGCVVVGIEARRGAVWVVPDELFWFEVVTILGEGNRVG